MSRNIFLFLLLIIILNIIGLTIVGCKPVEETSNKPVDVFVKIKNQEIQKAQERCITECSKECSNECSDECKADFALKIEKEKI